MFNKITAYLKDARIDYGNAVNKPEGIKLHPASITDFRFIINFFEKEKIPFHTFQLQEEKQLHIILRGILENWSEDKIKADLEDLGFHPSKVQRWRYKDGKPMPLVQVLIPKTEKSIFQITSIDQMSVKIEAQHSKTNFTQCHNCQLYGHSQSRCKAPSVCVKCAGQHHTTQCIKKMEIPPTCANCNGNHPASFQGCPKHPKVIKENAVAKKANNNQTQNTVNTFKWGNQNLKNSSQLNAQSTSTPTAANQHLSQNHVPQIFQAFTEMNNAMQLFFTTFQKQMTNLQKIHG